MRPPKSIRPMLPPYACCEICGEHRLPALRTRPIDGRVLCIRCTSKKCPKPGRCSWCDATKVHLEDHHPWGEKLQTALGGIATNRTWPICENCHAWISYYLLPLMGQQDSNATSAIILIIEMVMVVVMYTLAVFKPQVALTVRKAILEMGRNAEIKASSP